MNWKNFDENHLDELVKLYKGGAKIAELKKKFRCNGNPLVARLKEAGVYKADGAVKRAKKATDKPKAARKRRELVGNRITVLEKGRKGRQKATPATPAAKPLAATGWTPAEETEIARLMGEHTIIRSAAIRMMKRNAAKAAQPTPVAPVAAPAESPKVVDPLA